MQISKFRVLLSFIAALGAGAAVYGILRSYPGPSYVAVAVGYTAGVFCLGWQAGLAERCLGQDSGIESASLTQCLLPR